MRTVTTKIFQARDHQNNDYQFIVTANDETGDVSAVIERESDGDHFRIDLAPSQARAFGKLYTHWLTNHAPPEGEAAALFASSATTGDAAAFREAGRQRAELAGLTIGHEIVEDGVSATPSAERDVYLELWAYLDAHSDVRTVICPNTGPVSHDSVEAQQILDEFDARGISIVLLNGFVRAPGDDCSAWPIT